MLKSLLVERFNLAIHHETKESSGYLLIVERDELKLKKRNPGDGGEPRNGSSRRVTDGFHVMRRDTSVTALADYLGAYVLDRPVIDETGLAGTFDFDLTWNPDDSQFGGQYTVEGSILPDLFAAVREQIGLRLKPAKVPVDLIVIDHAERVAEN